MLMTTLRTGNREGAAFVQSMMDKLTRLASGDPQMFADLVKKCRGKADLPFRTVHHLKKVGILTASGGLENATINVVIAASAGPDSNPQLRSPTGE